MSVQNLPVIERTDPITIDVDEHGDGIKVGDGDTWDWLCCQDTVTIESTGTKLTLIADYEGGMQTFVYDLKNEINPDKIGFRRQGEEKREGMLRGSFAEWVDDQSAMWTLCLKIGEMQGLEKLEDFAQKQLDALK